jgi:hypothetical protein
MVHSLAVGDCQVMAGTGLGHVTQSASQKKEAPPCSWGVQALYPNGVGVEGLEPSRHKDTGV